MSKGQKIVTALLWGVLVSVMVGVIGAGAWGLRRPTSPSEPPLKILFDVPAFALMNQDNQPITSADLRGRPWIAAFIFTHCPDVCPMMSNKMTALQKTLDPRVKLVSFTVDPERDTPEVLKAYAKAFQAEPGRWDFLTGTPDQMSAVARGMKIALQPAQGAQPLVHATFLLLIDADGHARGIYHTADPKETDAMMRLAHDAAALAGGKPQ